MPCWSSGEKSVYKGEAMNKSVFITAAFLLLSFIPVQADNLTLFVDCAERPADSGAVRIWLGYTASEEIAATNALVGVLSDGTGLSPGIGGIPPEIFTVGTHRRVFSIEFPAAGYDVTWAAWNADLDASVTFNADTAAPDCGAFVGTGEPDGGLDVITVYDVEGDLFTWEVRDVYGNWHDISDVTTPRQCEDGRCFSRLVLGQGASTDPADYRVEAVDTE